MVFLSNERRTINKLRIKIGFQSDCDARRFNFFLKGNAIIKVEETFAAVTDINHPPFCCCHETTLFPPFGKEEYA